MDKKEEEEINFLLKLDMARLSRAIYLIGKVLRNIEDIDTGHLSMPIRLYCSKYEIQIVKNTLEKVVKKIKKGLEK